MSGFWEHGNILGMVQAKEKFFFGRGAAERCSQIRDSWSALAKTGSKGSKMAGHPTS